MPRRYERRSALSPFMVAQPAGGPRCGSSDGERGRRGGAVGEAEQRGVELDVDLGRERAEALDATTEGQGVEREALELGLGEGLTGLETVEERADLREAGHHATSAFSAA